MPPGLAKPPSRPLLKPDVSESRTGVAPLARGRLCPGSRRRLSPFCSSTGPAPRSPSQARNTDSTLRVNLHSPGSPATMATVRGGEGAQALVRKTGITAGVPTRKQKRVESGNVLGGGGGKCSLLLQLECPQRLVLIRERERPHFGSSVSDCKYSKEEKPR